MEANIIQARLRKGKVKQAFTKTQQAKFAEELRVLDNRLAIT
jgi:hypothetical protein